MDQQAQTEPLGQTYTYNQDYHKMADFLGVNIYDRSNDELAKKVSALAEWAENKIGKKDMNATLTEVAKLQKGLGIHFIGKPLVTELYKHMRLSQANEQPPAPIQPQAPSMRPKPVVKVEVKPKEKAQSKSNSLEEAITHTVQQSVSDIVGRVLKDKKLMDGTIQEAVKGALK